MELGQTIKFIYRTSKGIPLKLKDLKYFIIWYNLHT